MEPISFTTLDYISWFLFDFRKLRINVFPHFAYFFGNADADFYLWSPLLPRGNRRRTQICNWAPVVLLSYLLLLGAFIYPELWILIPLVIFGCFFAAVPGRGCVIHVEHYLFTPVPFFDLRRLHEATDFDTPRTIRGFLRGVARILQIQKRQRSPRTMVPAQEMRTT